MKEMDNISNNYKLSDVELIEVISFLWGKRKPIAIITALFTFIGFLYAFFIANPMYKSSTSLYPINQEQSSTSQLQILAAQFGIGGLSSSSNHNIPDIVKSRRIRKKIIEKKWKTEKFPKTPVYLYDFWGFDDDNVLVKKENSLKRLSELINVESDDETGLITVSILTEEPILSANIVNFIAQETIQYMIYEEQKQGGKNRVFIEQRLAKAVQDLTASEEALKIFRENNRNIDGIPQLQLEYERLKRNIEIKQEIYYTLEKQKELALIEEAKDVPIVNILDVGEPAIEKAEPKRLIILIVFFAIGFIVSLLSSYLIQILLDMNLIKIKS